jgi:squalene-associated FAD-dependent desaturase
VSASRPRPHVVVVGGGLAGLSAAIACLDGGAQVTVLEARPRLGGATWSFSRNGLDFDNGQHVYLRCCTAYQRFLERVGTAHLAPLQDRLAVPVIRPAAGAGEEPVVAWLRRDPLPAPLHLARSLLGYRHLSLADRLRLGRAAVALRRLRLDDPALDEQDLAAFLARHGQRRAAVSALWELIALPTTNVRAAECSLALAAKVFKTGLLLDGPAADIGWARAPLARLHADPAEQLLTRHGATVRRRAKVDELVVGGGTVQGVRCGGEVMEADGVVLAVPHTAAASLLPAGSIERRDELEALGVSPIIDVNVVFDRAVTGHQLAAAVDSPVQFVFDRTLAAGLDPAEGQVLAVSVSGADAEHGQRPEVLIERYTAALGELFPAARHARVLDAVVTREHEATFRGRPGTAALRPGAGTRLANLVVAGAWTDTGWPATMEGAVRSGNRAASRLLAHVAGEHRRLGGPGAAGGRGGGNAGGDTLTGHGHGDGRGPAGRAERAAPGHELAVISGGSAR